MVVDGGVDDCVEAKMVVPVLPLGVARFPPWPRAEEEGLTLQVRRA